jgi:hypothetical protein
MRAFKHPTSAGDTPWTPSEPSHAGQPASPSSRGEAPGHANELAGEWEDLWIDLGGEG